MLTKKTVSIIVILAVCTCLWALSPMRTVMSELSDSQIQGLLSAETLEAYTVDGQSTSKLLPNSTIIKDLAQRTENLDGTFSVSLSTFVEYSDSLKSKSDDQKLLELFNMAQSISTIKGVTYLSHSSGYKPEVLFSDAYFVESEKSKKKVADPVFSAVVERLTSYAWLKDNRFGGNTYKVDYYCYNNEIFLEISNVNAMKYMGFKVLESNSLHLYLDALLTDEGVVISGLAVVYNQAPQVKVLFVTVDLPSAFLKRIDSLKNWMCEKIAEKQ